MCGIIIPRFVLHLDVEITTNALTLWGIFGRRKETHDMIMELHDQGYLGSGPINFIEAFKPL